MNLDYLSLVYNLLVTLYMVQAEKFAEKLEWRNNQEKVEYQKLCLLKM